MRAELHPRRSRSAERNQPGVAPISPPAEKPESEARAAAKRAAAEYDMAMMARLCAPIPYANDPEALWRDIEADQRAAAEQSNGAGAVPPASAIQSGKARPSTTAAPR